MSEDTKKLKEEIKYLKSQVQQLKEKNEIVGDDKQKIKPKKEKAESDNGTEGNSSASIGQVIKNNAKNPITNYHGTIDKVMKDTANP